MDIIEMTREMGRELQKDERYLALHAASDACDKDEELQKLIGEFNLKRMSLDNETHKEEQDPERLQMINAELRALYAQVMQNTNMAAYNAAKQEMDTVLQRISAIISQCVEGENPDTADYEESCSGSCSTCGGCH